ncbi:MAG TPA: cytochrome P450 [Acidimicrobiales bacterium]|nr:cytochrome P450 [Acidimicrobiales bacterium]
MPVADLAELGLAPATPGFFLRPDYYEVLARLRTEAPLYRLAPGVRLVSRYHDIRQVSLDPDRFCSSRGVLVNDPIREGRPIEGSILHMDPPEHSALRRVLNREFAVRAVARVEEPVRALARELLDAVPAGEVVDYVGELSAPLPVLVIAELLGVADADRRDFRRWSDATIEAADGAQAMTEQVMADMIEFASFLEARAAERRRAPRDDVISLLVTAEVDGRRLTDAEVLLLSISLVVAGNETTRHLLSGTAVALAEHPDQRAALAADPDILPGAVEECLRWVTPIQMFGRTATRPTEVAGEHVDEGEFLLMLYASGNRDESVFGPTADRFDVSRPTTPPHLGFGFGVHLCLGAALARLEARVFLRELLARYPTWDLAGEPTWVASSLVRGQATLPLVLHAR